jgi:hypothetical protein
MERTATLSACSRYRYVLTRTWNINLPTILWIMLNPSTADAYKDDATIRRVIGFSQAWRFGSLVVCNIYGLRATKPKELWLVSDPFGLENKLHIMVHAAKTDRVVCAWGGNADKDQAQSVVRLILNVRAGMWQPNALYCLGTTKDGQPLHPLRLRKDTELREYAAL